MAYDANSCYYKLALSNHVLENESDVQQKSTASNMTLLLDDELNVQNHLYMRSLSAECCIDNLSLSNLPLTFSNRESIYLSLVMPPSISDGNAIVTEAYVANRNSETCAISMSNVTTQSSREAINYVNLLLQESVNKFLLFRYLECLCDADLFRDDVFHMEDQKLHISSDDSELLVWYLETSILMRLQTIAAINEAINED